MKGLILAGGKGTRLRPLTLNTPKPIVPVANRPFLLYQIDLMKSVGISEIILSLSYQSQKIEDLVKDGADLNIVIRYAIESSPLGTGGAFKNAEEWIDSTTVVFNGDVLTSLDLESVIDFHRNKDAIATLVLKRVDDPTAYGLVECDDEGRIHRFLEKPRMDVITSDTINAGVYVLEPSVLKHLSKEKPCSFERELFPKLSELNERIYGLVTDSYWIDIGMPSKYLEVHRDILNGKFHLSEVPPKGLSRDKLPRSTFVDEISIVGPGVTLGENVRIERSVVGSNCKIDKDVSIVNSVIWSDNRIDAGAQISGALIGCGCYIGRAAMLTPGTVLGGNDVVTDHSSL